MKQLFKLLPLEAVRTLRRWKQYRYSLVDRLVRTGLISGGSDHYQKFIVVSRSRTGSTLVDHTLRNHPEIIMDGEILNRLQGRRAEQIITRFFGSKPASVAAVGFKVFYYHPLDGDPQKTFDHLRAMDNVKFIHLVRKDRLAVHLSYQLARRSQAWSSSGSGRSTTVGPVPIDPEDCLKDFRRSKEMEERFEAQFSECEMLKLVYEDVVENFDFEMVRLQEYLGVSRRKAVAPTVKQSRGPLDARISNYDELKAFFAGTEWSSLFVRS